jgi:hypothetical protein
MRNTANACAVVAPRDCFSTQTAAPTDPTMTVVGQDVPSRSADLVNVAAAWNDLPKATREAILLLVRASKDASG